MTWGSLHKNIQRGRLAHVVMVRGFMAQRRCSLLHELVFGSQGNQTGPVEWILPDDSSRKASFGFNCTSGFGIETSQGGDPVYPAQIVNGVRRHCGVV